MHQNHTIVFSKLMEHKFKEDRKGVLDRNECRERKNEEEESSLLYIFIQIFLYYCDLLLLYIDENIFVPLSLLKMKKKMLIIKKKKVDPVSEGTYRNTHRLTHKRASIAAAEHHGMCALLWNGP